MKLVLFDCDGTLLDSQHVIVAAVAEAFDTHGLPQPGRDRTLSIVGLSVPEAVGALLPDADRATIHAVGETYKKASGALRAKPGHREPMYQGARELVVSLARQPDLVLGVATGKSRRGVEAFFEANDLKELFATIQTADSAPSKPHPAMILQAMTEVGAEAAETVMIGDTTFDMVMAVKAGVAALGVAWGYHAAESLARAGASAVARDFAELHGHIGRTLSLGSDL